MSHSVQAHLLFGFVPVWFPALAYFGGIIALMFLGGRKARRTAKFGGPALTGTAQWAARGGGLAGLFAGGYGGGSVMCKIALSVAIPGRPPHDVTVRTPVGSRTLGALCVDGQRWEPGQHWHVKPGTTVAVEVDSANPEKVRIDFSQLMTQYPESSYSPAPQRRSWFGLSGLSPVYRVLLVGWWVVCAGVIIFVASVLITHRFP